MYVWFKFRMNSLHPIRHYISPSIGFYCFTYINIAIVSATIFHFNFIQSPCCQQEVAQKFVVFWS